MNMSNEEKEKIIKETLMKDTHILSGSESLKLKIKEDINTSKIKVKKYTFSQRRFTKFIVIILFISLGFNAYLAYANINKYLIAQNSNINNENIKEVVQQEEKIENIEVPVKKEENIQIPVNQEEKIENVEVSDISTVTQIAPKNEIEDVIVEDKNSEKSNYILELDDEILKEELSNYAISIGRFEGSADTLEENTILLLMTSESFSNKRGTTGSTSISSKYALTVENVHLFLAELTGINCGEFLKSYANYIGYSEFSKGYVFGKDANIFKNEKYEVLELKSKGKNNSDYKISGTLQKISGDKKCLYEFNAVVGINVEYTYSPYKIKSFTAKLKEGYTDNIVRLVDYVEEIKEK